MPPSPNKPGTTYGLGVEILLALFGFRRQYGFLLSRCKAGVKPHGAIFRPERCTMGQFYLRGIFAGFIFARMWMPRHLRPVHPRRRSA